MEESLPDASFEAQWITCSQNQGTKSQDLQAGDSQAVVYSHWQPFVLRDTTFRGFPPARQENIVENLWKALEECRDAHTECLGNRHSATVCHVEADKAEHFDDRGRRRHMRKHGTHFNQRWFCKVSGILSDEETEDQKYTIQGSKWRGWTWSSPVPTPHLSPHCQSKRGGPDTV